MKYGVCCKTKDNQRQIDWLLMYNVVGSFPSPANSLTGCMTDNNDLCWTTLGLGARSGYRRFRKNVKVCQLLTSWRKGIAYISLLEEQSVHHWESVTMYQCFYDSKIPLYVLMILNWYKERGWNTKNKVMLCFMAPCLIFLTLHHFFIWFLYPAK